MFEYRMTDEELEAESDRQLELLISEETARYEEAVLVELSIQVEIEDELRRRLEEEAGL